MYFILKAMKPEEMRAYILKELSHSVPPEKIIYELAEKSGTHWGEIQALVKQVQSESRGQVARTQSPLFLALAVVSGLAGLGLIIGGSAGIYGITAATQASTLGVEALAPIGTTSTLFYLLNFGGPFLSMIGLGLAMLVGTVWGLRRLRADLASDAEPRHER